MYQAPAEIVRRFWLTDCGNGLTVFLGTLPKEALMRAILMLFDTLNRAYLPPYGCEWTKMPSFQRLAEHTAVFDNFYGGSLPCMPARRELHTGRYNFLHSSWSPMNPFDDSVVERMRKAGIYTHIATDHFHYWEDGGSGYLTKFDSHEIVRGQQGDPWIGQVERPYFPETLSKRSVTENWRHDWINRSFMKSEEDMPQHKTFSNGLDFIERNHDSDNWFLQIEAFDPHEPFFTQDSWKKLYDDDYDGKNLDWPDYGRNHYGEEATKHVRYEYAALLSMCDHYLGKLLDAMDKYSLWDDTMLIVATDHGFMLGEKEWMGKNIQPMYQELVHNPFFIHDPRHPEADGKRRSALSQTVDVVPTLASFFNIEPPEYMDGRDMEKAIAEDAKIREGAIFGIFGGHVNVTDGRYVYMHAPATPDNQPLYEYTLMPMHMRSPFEPAELSDAELFGGFSFLRSAKVLRVHAENGINPYWYGTRLYDLSSDPEQSVSIRDDDTEKRLLSIMRDLMKENEAPSDQYIRLGIPEEGEITDEMIEGYHSMDWMGCQDSEGLCDDARLAAAVMVAETGQETLGLIKDFAGKAGKRISGRDLLDAVPLIFSDERMRRKAMKAELYI